MSALTPLLDLSNKQYINLTEDILNRNVALSPRLRLKPFEDKGPDLVSYDSEGKIEAAVRVLHPEFIRKSPDKQFEEFVHEASPKRIVIVRYSTFSEEEKSYWNSMESRFKGLKVYLKDLLQMLAELQQLPEVAKKFEIPPISLNDLRKISELNLVQGKQSAESKTNEDETDPQSFDSKVATQGANQSSVQQDEKQDETSPQNQKETPIDETGNLVYGQHLGDEIKDYDVFFMPQSFGEVIGKNGISNAILDILGIDRDEFRLSDDVFDEQGFQWVEWRDIERNYHKNFCFILSRNRNKHTVGFTDSLKHAIHKSKIRHNTQDEPLKIFVPLIGAGAGSLDVKVSLNHVLDGIELMQQVFDQPKIRINLSLENEEQTQEYVDIIRKRFKLEVSPQEPIYISSTSKIAKISGDVDNGEDYLDIKKDVEAFAKIIASSSFIPPLAIALFGEWGSGKSFFMKKLKDKISQYSKNERNEEKPIYCKGIAQIHFNAWSYLDDNLFASIVSEVFDKLDEFITGDNAAKHERQEIENDLADKLQSVKEQQEMLLLKKKQHESDIFNLTRSIQRAKKQLEKEAKAIKGNTFEKIRAQINKDYDPKGKLEIALQGVTINNEQIDFKEPEQALNELKSTRVFILNLMRFIGSKKENGIWLLVALIVILAMTSFSFFKFDFNIVVPQIMIAFLAPIPVIWKSVKNTINFLSPIINKVTVIKNEYDNRLKEAQSRFEQQEKASKILIEQKRHELHLFDQKKGELYKKIDEINHLLKHRISQKAMYSFISKRSKSDDYKKHLGIISTIRKDFETLSNLFDQSKKEYEDFRGQFENPLERIVLYIDDLDRCSEEKVIEVLEAVNLLLAFPLFVVVVGVDPRWIKNALINRYHLQFGNNAQELGLDKINASNYLEKIFQVPFQLETASDKSVKSMIANLASIIVEEDTTTLKKPEVSDSQFGKVTPPNNDEPKANPEPAKPLIEKDIVDEPRKIVEVNTLESDNLPHNEEHLALTDREVELMQDLSEIIGNNPRAIKRFVNVYHIVRAHEGLSLKSDNVDKEYLILMFLLAMPIGGFSGFYQDFINFTNEASNEDLAIGLFLSEIEKENKILNSKQAQFIGWFYPSFGKSQSRNDIIESAETKSTLLQISAEEFRLQNKFIQRFTFRNML